MKEACRPSETCHVCPGKKQIKAGIIIYYMTFKCEQILKHQGAVSERRLSENSEYVNPEMRETLGFPFQKGRFVKPEKAG